MEDRKSVYGAQLITQLENRPSVVDSGTTINWYVHLERIGKQAQTEEMVQAAIKQFNVEHKEWLLLNVIAKKFLTREICELAVRNNGLNLKYVPKMYCDENMVLIAVRNNGDVLRDVPDSILYYEKGYEICRIAVSNNSSGDALEYVPRQWLQDERGYEICRIAVSNSSSGEALAYVPQQWLHGKRGKEICKAAVNANGYAIKYVPQKFLSKQLIKDAINAPASEKMNWSIESIISWLPKRCMSEEIVAMITKRWPISLRVVPMEFVTPALCNELVLLDPTNLRYIPVQLMSKDLIDNALRENPRVILYLPNEKLTEKRCLDAVKRDPTIPIDKFPESIYEFLEKKMKAFVTYSPEALIPPTQNENKTLSSKSTITSPTHHDITLSDGAEREVYYITDIHLEHHISSSQQLKNMSVYKIKQLLENKIAELVSSASNKRDILLVGGDVADSVALEKLFYEQLTAWNGWTGKIIAILGNHELWDKTNKVDESTRTVDEIISDYRQIMPYNVTLLENELFIVYKGQRDFVLDEQTILRTSDEELYEVCKNSTFILLGGIGFSGLNPTFNANARLYGSVVTAEEDFERSKRFCIIYEKMLACANELPVIVLTHTPMPDWSTRKYNPKWIYVSGHTHRNKFILNDEGIAVLADNQIGYFQKPWTLKKFSMDLQRYDPFAAFPDGIHEISREQYIEFNRGQGIMINDMKSPGTLYAIKCDKIYMFVLKTEKSLCLLEGGTRHKLSHDLNYYSCHLREYTQKVRAAFTPYRNALLRISKEIQTIGGNGKIHGCIVDIDWFHHLYLNPFDGKITPYFATDITQKEVYSDVETLLTLSPMPPCSYNGEALSKRYIAASNGGEISILSNRQNNELATVPEVVLDRSMYQPSRIMRSIQYIFDQNILRIWNDEILLLPHNPNISLTSSNMLE